MLLTHQRQQQHACDHAREPKRTQRPITHIADIFECRPPAPRMQERHHALEDKNQGDTGKQIRPFHPGIACGSNALSACQLDL